MASLAERLPEASPSFSFAPDKEPIETSLLRLTKRKFWLMKEFRKTTKGRGFLPKKFQVEFERVQPDNKRARYILSYSRINGEEDLDIVRISGWQTSVDKIKKDMPPIVTGFEEQRVNFHISKNPMLSTTLYTKERVVLKDGHKIHDRSYTPIDEFTNNAAIFHLRQFTIHSLL